MAQSGFTPISQYYSTTAAAVPTAGNLVNGELALNITDGKIFYKDNAGAVQVIGTKGGVGSSTTTQVLYNSSGLVVGSANMTFNGTTLTLANDASISGLTVGKGGGSVSTNTALGASAMVATATGGYNSAFGGTALTANTTGGSNSVFGYASMATNTGGGENSSFGVNSLNKNTTGSYNVAVGTGALQANTTASNNTAVGYQAAYTNTTGTGLTVVGRQALYGNTTGSNNIAIGDSVLGGNTTGSSNVGMGVGALQFNSTASNNTAVGYRALYLNTGEQSVAVGAYAAASQSTGAYNTTIGYDSMSALTTGQVNTCLGYGAGNGLTTSSSNTLIGAAAGQAITTGAKNSILGRYNGNQSGLDIRTASNYIVLSDGDGNPRGYFDPTGYFYCLQSYTGTTAAAANVNITSSGAFVRSTSALKYKKNIRDLESIDINKFRPVRYKSKCENDDQTKDYFGIVADEVNEVGITELVNYGAEGEVEGFQYERLTVVLLKAVQELKAEVDALKAVK